MDLEVVGRHALLFDDDSAAAFVNSGEALVDWNSLLIDRYDVRHLLSAPPPPKKRRPLSPPSAQSAVELDHERYLDLKPDTYQQESDVGANSVELGGYHSVAFSYGNAADNTDQKSSNDGTEYSEFQPPFPIPESLLHCLPPTEKVHQIIARTALFVSKNGGQSEIVLRVKQGNNPTFAFLMPDNHLHPYFRYLIDHQDLLKSDLVAKSESKDQSGKANGVLSLLGSIYGSGDDEDTAIKNMSELKENESGKTVDASVLTIGNGSQETEILAKANEKDEALSKHLSPEKENIQLLKKNTLMKVSKAGIPTGKKKEPRSLPKITLDKSSSLASVTAFTVEPVIVEPPSDIKKLVDRVVEFILKNGPQFEAVLTEQDDKYGRFPFLLRSNPFNSYYVNVLRKAQEMRSDDLDEDLEAARRASLAEMEQGASGVDLVASRSKAPVRRRALVDEEIDEGGRRPSPIEMNRAGEERTAEVDRTVDADVRVLDVEEAAEVARIAQIKRKADKAAARKAAKKQKVDASENEVVGANSDRAPEVTEVTNEPDKPPSPKGSAEVAPENMTPVVEGTKEPIKSPFPGAARVRAPTSFPSDSTSSSSSSVETKGKGIREIMDLTGATGIFDPNPGAGLLAMAALQQFPSDLGRMETNYAKMLALGQSLIPQSKLPGKMVSRLEKKSSLGKQSDSKSLGPASDEIPNDYDRKEKFKMVLGKSKKDGDEPSSTAAPSYTIDAAQTAAILQAATRGVKSSHFVPNISLNGDIRKENEGEGQMTEEQKVKAERLKRAKMFVSMLKSGAPHLKSETYRSLSMEPLVSGKGRETSVTNDEYEKKLSDSEIQERISKRKYRSMSSRYDGDEQSDESEDGKEENKEKHFSEKRQSHRSSRKNAMEVDEEVKDKGSRHGKRKHRSHRSSRDNDLKEEELEDDGDDDKYYRHDKRKHRSRHSTYENDEEVEKEEGRDHIHSNRKHRSNRSLRVSDVEEDEEDRDYRHGKRKHRSHRSSHKDEKEKDGDGRDHKKSRKKHCSHYSSDEDDEENDDYEEKHSKKKHRSRHSSRISKNKYKHPKQLDEDQSNSSSEKLRNISQSVKDLEEGEISSKSLEKSREASIDVSSSYRDGRAPSQPSEATEVPDDLRAKIRAMLMANF